MIKRLLPLFKYIIPTVKLSTKFLQIQQIQMPKQHKINKSLYNFSREKKISIKEVEDYIEFIQYQIENLYDSEERFQNQLQVVLYLEDNLKNCNDNQMDYYYIQELLILHRYQIANYAYIDPQNPLNNQLTYKLINNNFKKQLDKIKQIENLEPENLEYFKIRLNAASIMCNMINYGVEADIDQLHDWMNDYLDQLEILDKICSEIQSKYNIYTSYYMTYVDRNDIHINFFFFIAQIHKQRNLMDEFERFFNQGIQEVESRADKILTMLEGNFDINLILINLSQVFTNFRSDADIKPEIKQNLVMKLIDLFSTYYSRDDIVYYIVFFADYLVSENLFEKAAELLKGAYEFKANIDSEVILLLLYKNIYEIQKFGFLKEIDMKDVLTQVENLNYDNFDDIIIYLYFFHKSIFNEILETKDLDKIKEQFDKVIFCIQELSKVMKKNKIKAQLPIFDWIDSVLTNNLLLNNDYYILAIYNALSEFKDIKLIEDLQNMERDFYLIVLSFNLQDKINLDSQSKVNNVKAFAIKYIRNQGMQQIALNKLLLLNVKLIDDGYQKECIEIIDSLIEMLPKENDEINKFVKQFQNQKNQILQKKL